MTLPPLDDYAALMPFIDRWEKEQAEFLGALLYDALHPQSVIDWGCASGLYLLPFKERGCEVAGVDADPQAGKLLDPREFFQEDIRRGNRILGHCDLALCIETAEHIQPEYADLLVNSVANSADTIFWSAAHEGQGGLNHHHERDPLYWFRLFEARGYAMHPANGDVLAAIQSNPACQKVEWLLPNAMLLTK